MAELTDKEPDGRINAFDMPRSEMVTWMRIFSDTSMKTNVIRTRILIIRIVACTLRHILAIKMKYFSSSIITEQESRLKNRRVSGTILAIFSLVSRYILEFSRVFSKKCAFFPMRAQLLFD